MNLLISRHGFRGGRAAAVALFAAQLVLLPECARSIRGEDAAPAATAPESVKPAPAQETPPTSAEEAPHGRTKAKIPPPLKTYQGREIAVTMHYTGAPWLVRESREREEDCTTMLKALNLKSGQVICDMGCGNGFYTLKLAGLVGKEGQVLAVDIQPEMLSLLRRAPTPTI